MKQIPLTKGKYALIDDEDYPVLSRFIWRLDEGGKPITQLTSIDGYTPRPISITKFLLKQRPKYKVSFKNNDYLDCRKCNLELRLNNQIIHKAKKAVSKGGKKCTSKYKGVYWDKSRNKWFARISRNKKYVVGRRCETEVEAALWYNKQAKELYGNLAYQNKI